MQPKMDGKRCDSAGDLGGLPEDSDVDPRRIKTPLKLQARDQCDWLRGSHLNLKCLPSGGKPRPQSV